MTKSTTISADEIARFSAQAEDWWNPDGAFRTLHQINPLRVEYVRDRVCEHFGREAQRRDSLHGLDILDTGCGGGLLSEPLARMGAKVTGLDASTETVAIARNHAEESGLIIDYRTGGVEELARGTERFDVITALEILEHVADVGAFVSALAALLKPDGVLVMSTLNRTKRSYILGVVMAEYVLGMVPAGTHDWDKFIRPSELVGLLEKRNLVTTDITGMPFNPFRREFELRKGRLGVNYLLTAKMSRQG